MTWIETLAKITGKKKKTFICKGRTPVNEYLYHVFQNFPTKSHNAI